MLTQSFCKGMVLTHQYLRYAHHSAWGVVASPTSNILLLKNSIVVCPALEKVIIVLSPFFAPKKFGSPELYPT